MSLPDIEMYYSDIESNRTNISLTKTKVRLEKVDSFDAVEKNDRLLKSIHHKRTFITKFPHFLKNDRFVLHIVCDRLQKQHSKLCRN